MRDPVLLVVDDDELVIGAVKLALPAHWRMLASQSETAPERGYHAALVDMHLRDSHNDGLQVIRALRAKHPQLEIAAMSGNLDRELMESALNAGATRFLAKPLSLEEVQLTLGKMEAYLDLRDSKWVGSGKASKTVKREIAQMRGEDGPILIEGESGTGKEICAQLIHAQEKEGPLVVINVASVPENLFESEFFGHVKGAFTGADQNKMGLAEAAQGGDLFLDEVEALSPALQAKLLRFLESGEVRRIGGKETVIIQTRVIAATNRNLTQLVREGKFREDLLWRLNGKKISLLPLRERREDIPELVRHFLSLDKSRRKDVSDDAMQTLTEYSWPGNVRELKRVCEQLLLSCPLPVIRESDVRALVAPPAPSQAAPENIDLSRGIGDLVNEFEAQIIQKAIESKNDIDDVARLLKISRSSLYKKIKDHDLQWRS